MPAILHDINGTFCGYCGTGVEATADTHECPTVAEPLSIYDLEVIVRSMEELADVLEWDQLTYSPGTRHSALARMGQWLAQEKRMARVTSHQANRRDDNADGGS